MRNNFMVEFTGTPEAGKTTAIHNIYESLKSKGYEVEILAESAEKLPSEIPKGIWDANLWMHYQTQAGILRAKHFNADIVLIDRGLVDSKFYGKKFLWNEEITNEQYRTFRKQFINELFPNLIIALTVSPEIAIKRKGKIGKLVNIEYLTNYNKMFKKFYEEEIHQDKILINTSEFTKEDVAIAIEEFILSRVF